MNVESLISAGQDALHRKDWAGAKASFEAAHAIEPTPDVSLWLGSTVWWLGEVKNTIAHLELAYGGFFKLPNPEKAAICALRLAFSHRYYMAAAATASGWLGRATRLIEEHGLVSQRGRMLLVKGYIAEDLADGETWTREALEHGKKTKDFDIELWALSQLGGILVQQGRVKEGLALLDEAMAGCTGGEAKSLDTVVWTNCITMVSCARCADFERAVHWVRAAEAAAHRLEFPFFFSQCRNVHAAVLLATGDWARAEEMAKSALEMAREIPARASEAIATLAEIRLNQGKLEEAERLVRDLESRPAIVPVLAKIQLAKNKPAVAAVTAQRRLDLLSVPSLDNAVLEEIAGNAELAQNERANAAERGRRLVEQGREQGCQLMSARGYRLRGIALSERSDLDRALIIFDELGMPYEAARTRYFIAELLRKESPEAAAEETRTALSTFERLGAASCADKSASLLRELGVKASRIGPKMSELLTKREREIFALLGEGLTNPDIAKRLFLSRKTVEHHVAAVLEKLGLKSRAEAAAEWVRQNPPANR